MLFFHLLSIKIVLGKEMIVLHKIGAKIEKKENRV
jgi:hypothetical protein